MRPLTFNLVARRVEWTVRAEDRQTVGPGFVDLTIPVVEILKIVLPGLFFFFFFGR